MRKVRVATIAHQSRTDSATQLEAALDDGTVMLAMIQALIPLGLRAVEETLQQEVAALAGARYAHADGHPGIARWGTQRGSIYLADQKLPISVPRVRDLQAKAEVPLPTYVGLQTPRARDVGLFRRVLAGISTREYEAAAEAVPDAFGRGPVCRAGSSAPVPARCTSSTRAATMIARGWCYCWTVRRSPRIRS